MIQLLFLVLFVEAVVAFLMLVKIGPLRELVMKSLDQVKLGKGPATVKTIAGTMSVILLSSLMNIVKIQNKGAKLGTMSPMDQVLWRTHLLEASLMGSHAHVYVCAEEVELNMPINGGTLPDKVACNITPMNVDVGGLLIGTQAFEAEGSSQSTLPRYVHVK